MCLKVGSLRQSLLVLLWLDAPNDPPVRSKGLNMLFADANTYCVSFGSSTRMNGPFGNRCVDDVGLEGKRKAQNGSHRRLFAKTTPAHRHIMSKTTMQALMGL